MSRRDLRSNVARERDRLRAQQRPRFDLLVVAGERTYVDPATNVPILGREPERGIVLQVAEPQTWLTVEQADLVTNAFVESCNVSRAHVGDLRRFVADVVVDPMWRTEFFTGSAYWGRLIRTLDNKAWIVVETATDDAYEPSRPEWDAEALAVAAKPDAKLPDGYHRLDLDAAFVEGCKRWGVGWFEDTKTDAARYDVAVQLSLFGEVRYG